MSWCIYKHTNKINGKVYVGQTCQKPEERWRNGDGYQHNPLFYNAILKYGWNSFAHEIIENNIINQKEANEKEMYYIAQYNSYEDGYNLTKGGDNREHLGKSVLQINMDTLCVVAEYPTLRHAARTFEGDHTLIARVCNKQKINDRYNVSAYGFYWCYKEDYFEGWKPLSKRENHSSGEEIYQLQKQGQDYIIIETYPSILEASNQTNIPNPNIWQCCNNGTCITAGGFYWCYVKNWDKNWQPRVDGNKARYKRVKRLEDGKIYCSIAEAARDSNIGCSETITRVCKGRQKTAGGYHWEYVIEGGEE